jgi:hypothetical protein
MLAVNSNSTQGCSPPLFHHEMGGKKKHWWGCHFKPKFYVRRQIEVNLQPRIMNVCKIWINTNDLNWSISIFDSNIRGKCSKGIFFPPCHSRTAKMFIKPRCKGLHKRPWFVLLVAGSIFEEGPSLGLTLSIQTETGSVFFLGELLSNFNLKIWFASQSFSWIKQWPKFSRFQKKITNRHIAMLYVNSLGSQWCRMMLKFFILIFYL